MLIREQDAYFDDIFHGSWVYFALASVVFFVWKAFKQGKDNALKTLAEYMQSPPFTTMSFGLRNVGGVHHFSYRCYAPT